jgi:hypothetical protein
VVQGVGGNLGIEEFGMERIDTGKDALLSQTRGAPRPYPEERRRHGAANDAAACTHRLPSPAQLGLLALGVVVVVCANAAGQIRLNIWQRDFYEAIEQRHVADFMTQLIVFAVIAGGLYRGRRLGVRQVGA